MHNRVHINANIFLSYFSFEGFWIFSKSCKALMINLRCKIREIEMSHEVIQRYWKMEHGRPMQLNQGTTYETLKFYSCGIVTLWWNEEILKIKNSKSPYSSFKSNNFNMLIQQEKIVNAMQFKSNGSKAALHAHLLTYLRLDFFFYISLIIGFWTGWFKIVYRQEYKTEFVYMNSLGFLPAILSTLWNSSTMFVYRKYGKTTPASPSLINVFPSNLKVCSKFSLYVPLQDSHNQNESRQKNLTALYNTSKRTVGAGFHPSDKE